MTHCTLEWAMGRVSVATPQSAVAIFRVPGLENEGIVDVVFESTVITKARLTNPDDLFIGVFHRNMGPDWVQTALTEGLSLCSE